MKLNTEELFKTIVMTIEGIEADLKKANATGIYFSPELYVAFCIGKEISRNSQSIFGTNNATWLREVDLGNGGPSDIVFKTNDHLTVLELKLRGTFDAYKADLEKLKRLKMPCDRIFCVGVDCFSATNDDRITRIEQEYAAEIHKIGHFSFPTWNNWYQRQVYFNLNLYRLN